jgi:hypothetical protein
MDFEGSAMRKIISTLAIALIGCGAASEAQPPPSVASSPPQPEAAPGAAAAAEAAAELPNLNDLATMTFDCPKAGLNAAAREAAKAPTRGSYQFSSFGIVSDGHHAAYEVQFKSNHHADPILKYCVAIYCQQGWDPRKTKTMVTLMEADSQPTKKTDARPDKKKGTQPNEKKPDDVVAHCGHETHATAQRAD